MADRGFNLFGLNAPSWSLFWEYVANLLYGLVLYKISRRYLLLLTFIAAVLLCSVAYRAGNLLGGWSGPTFWDGAVRVSFSFLAGLLIYRSKWIIQNKLGFIGVALLLSLAFVMPYTEWNWLTESLVVLFYFPLLIALGAGAKLNTGLKKICVFSGKISYPLYMSHYAVLWMFGNYYNSYKPDTQQLTIIIIAAVILLTIAAYLIMIFYDKPVRKYLSDKWNKKKF
ncbi:Acyltransferase family protein [compost metagenome]